MTVLRRTAAAVQVARGPSYIWRAGALGALRLGERVLLAAAFVSFVGSTRRSVELAAALGLVHLLRASLATGLRTDVHARMELAAAGAVLAADPMRAVATEGDDPLAALVEGADAGGELAAELVPDVAGDAVATVLVGGYVLASRPPVEIAVGLGVAAAASVVAVAVRRDTRRRAERAWRAYLPAWRQLRGVVGARVELVASGQGAEAEAELGRRLDGWRREEVRFRAVTALTGGAPTLVAWAAIAAALVLEWRGPFTPEALATAAVYAAAIPPLLGLLGGVQRMTKAERGFASLAAMLETAENVRAASGAGATSLSTDGASATGGELHARDVTYAYAEAEDPRSRALASASFTWRPGRLVVVTGPNGAGKSTLVRLLLALAPPAEGSLTVGDRPLASLDAVAWRRSIAYVPQLAYVDDDATVRDFVRLVVPDAADDAIRAALADLGLRLRATDPLLVRLRALSAGQRQRLLLARALVSPARRLLLDEPDANLDAAGIAVLTARLRELKTTRAVLVVAHARELIDLADDVVRLEPPLPAPRDLDEDGAP